MKSPFYPLRPRLGLFLATIAGIAFLSQVHAQDETPAAPELPPVPGAEIGEKIAEAASAHPAAEALTNYLKAFISNNHAEAARYIDPTSLETYKFRTLNAVRTQLDAVTLEGSKRDRLNDILTELGFDSMEQMTEMEAKEFYVKVNNRQVATNPMTTVTSMDNVNVKILGLAAEDDARTIHFTTRTSHREEVMLVSNLRLTSMIKAGREWRVSLQAQQPRMEPLSDDIIEREKGELENDPELQRLKKLLDNRPDKNPDESPE